MLERGSLRSEKSRRSEPFDDSSGSTATESLIVGNLTAPLRAASRDQAWWTRARMGYPQRPTAACETGSTKETPGTIRPSSRAVPESISVPVARGKDDSASPEHHAALSGRGLQRHLHRLVPETPD